MAIERKVYQYWNGTAWVDVHFKTDADVVAETDTEGGRRFVTTAQKTALGKTNAANGYLQLDSTGKISVGVIPGGLDYLPKSEPIFTGEIVGPKYYGVNNAAVIFGNKNSTATNVSELKFDTTGKVSVITKSGATENAFEVDTSLGGEISLKPKTYIDVNSKRITNVPAPQADTDAVNRGYVQSLYAYNLKPASAPVKVATTGNISLTGTQTIDGITLAANDRVLVWKQTTPAQNGIYTVASGAWVKQDGGIGGEVADDSRTGVLVFVEQGNTYNDWLFACTSTNTWAEFSKPDKITVNTSQLTKTGTQIGIKSGGVTATELASNAVETAKIKDGNVTAAKLASDAVETAKIKNAAVTNAKIAADAIKTAQIFNNAVTLAKFDVGYQSIRNITIGGDEPDLPNTYDIWIKPVTT